MTTWHIGPTRQYKHFADVAGYSTYRLHDGDTVLVDAGEYIGDPCYLYHSVTLKAIGGRARLFNLREDTGYVQVYRGLTNSLSAIMDVSTAQNRTGDIPSYSYPVDIYNFDIIGASDQLIWGRSYNSGIRHVSGKLRLHNCRIMNCSDGILTVNETTPRSELWLYNCGFSGGGGDGQGYAHNIYVGRIRKFYMIGCYSTSVQEGHLVKSRAQETQLWYNRFTDEGDFASHQIDIPNGGLFVAVGNILQKGIPSNPSVVAYGVEGYIGGDTVNPYAVNEIHFINNTLVCSKPAYTGALYVTIGSGLVPTKNIKNNVAYAPVGTTPWPLTTGFSNNFNLNNLDMPGRLSYDYKLDASLGWGVTSLSTDPGSLADGTSLTPTMEYVHPMKTASIPVTPYTPGALRSVVNLPTHSSPPIAGNTWTPERDPAGKVYDGNWQNLPLNTWLLVGTATLRSVVQAPYILGAGGYDGVYPTMAHWSGAAYDYNKKQMHCVGGGHGTHECETGIYTWDIPSCTWSRTQDRADASLLLAWRSGGTQFYYTPQGSPVTCPTLPDGGNFDAAGPYGRMGAVHTRYNLDYLPPEFMGNADGGIWQTLGVYNLSTHKYNTPWWFNDLPGHAYTQGLGGGGEGFFYGDSIYWLVDYTYITQMKLTEQQSTDWSVFLGGRLSDQKCYVHKFTHPISTLVGDETAHCNAREIGHYVVFGASTSGHVRFRYKAAVDSGLTSWAAYTDLISLTSSDGSHIELAPDKFTIGTYSKLGLCGACYDVASDCIWMMPNNVGDELYRIDGISAGNTWATTKIAGTGALKRMTNGTYGRLRLAIMGGKKILTRLSNADDPPQVMRIS